MKSRRFRFRHSNWARSFSFRVMVLVIGLSVQGSGFRVQSSAASIWGTINRTAMHRTAPHAARISSSMVFSFIVFELSRAPIVRGRGVLSFIGERLRFVLRQNTGTRRTLSLRTLTRARGRHLRSCRTSLFLFLAVLPQNTKRKIGENYSISFHFQCSFPSSSINENGVKS